jgi:Zn-dependent protease/CBS domain-containing protein
MAREADRGGILQASISLGRIWGIPIGLHYSWFIIAVLITLSLAGHFFTRHPEWAPALVWGASVLTAVLFFASLLAHELSHAVMAMRRGLPVRSITLFALGGIAQIEKDANTAKTEFLVAVVGPITSFVIGAVCISAASAMGWTLAGTVEAGVVAAILGWLGSINVLLAVFNLIPGYPLDGGRLLRAGLWAVTGDEDRASRAAAVSGQVVAGLFIAFGLFGFFLGAGFGGLWLAFIGWFLLSAAQSSYMQFSMMQLLRGVRVGDVMADECATVDAASDVQTVVDDMLLRRGRRCLMVTTNGDVVGLLTPNEVRRVDRSQWPALSVREVMRPLETLKSVTPETPLSEALTTMAREDVNQLPVMDRAGLRGMVTRGQILQLLEARAELRA